MPTVKLSDILFEDDILQELKMCNVNLANFLNRHEIVSELVSNITQLTEQDCCDKQLYSKVHAAYISCEILTGGLTESLLINHPEALSKIFECLESTKVVVPQKASLVSKLIGTIHSSAAANLSCHVTQDISTFKKLIDRLVDNIDVSGAFETLSTFIKRTTPPETRYVFCEVLTKLNFVNNLIDMMTTSGNEDKQRNACQLICDIIVIGRQEASEQPDSGPMAQDMLAESIESRQAVHRILSQMFPDDNQSSTSIVCGMKVLQTLLEKKTTSNEQLLAKTIQETQEEIEAHIIKFHELLMNPPKQEPIKTTFGIIQKPLGYTRLETVNLIRALISTNSPNIIRKLVELKTMKVIMDLFIQYYWNNLLHTQVEQALCLIIKNCRHDEELNYNIDMLQHIQHDNHRIENCNQPNSPVENGVSSNNDQPKSDDQIKQMPSEDMPPEETEISKEHDEKTKLEPPQQHQTESAENGLSDDQDQRNVDHPMEPVSPESQAPDEQSMKKTEQQDEKNDVEQEQKQTVCVENGFSNNQDQPKSNDLSDQMTQEETPLKETSEQSQKQDEKIELEQAQEHPEKSASNPDIPSRALLSQLLNDCDLIGRLLLPNKLEDAIIIKNNNSEQANFGHIIQIINSIAINRDLDTIRDHLNAMKDEKPDLYDKWTTFVNVDVASFKEISLYYDTQSAQNNVNSRYMNSQHNHISNNFSLNNNSSHLNSTPNNNGTADDQLLTYFSFSREVVIPAINKDVLPRLRRSKNAH